MIEALPRKSIRLSGDEAFSYFEAGSGRDVVLVHGAFVTSHDMVVSLFDRLAPRFHVVAPDRPGHGLSTRPRFRGSAAQQAAMIVEAMGVLGLERPLVIGHSFGGTVAVEIALGWPEAVSSVVAIAPLAFPEPRLEQFIFGARSAPILGDFAKEAGGAGPDAALLPVMWEAMFLPQRMPPSFRNGMAFDEVRSGRGLLSNGEDAMSILSLAANLPRYAACKVPIQILYGDQDTVVNPRLHARPLARLLEAPARRFKGLGHMLHHFEADAIFELAVEAMLDDRPQDLSKTA